MSSTREVAVDLALAEVKAAKKLALEARARYGPIRREIVLLEKEDADCTSETIARLAKKKSLEKEAARLMEAFNKPTEIVNAAVGRLRQVNGVSTVSVVTPEISELVMKRLAQGYSLNDVAMMAGCASSTVANLKAGRHVVSDLPADSKVGSRGHRKSSLKVL